MSATPPIAPPVQGVADAPAVELPMRVPVRVPVERPRAPEAAAATPPIQKLAPPQTQDAQDEKGLQQKVETATKQLNQVMETFDKGLRFRVHEGTGRTYVQVMDENSHKVVREIPTQKVLDMLARFHDVLGMIFDSQA